MWWVGMAFWGLLASELGATPADVALILSGVFAGTLPAIIGSIMAYRKAQQAHVLASRALKNEKRLNRIAHANHKLLKDQQPALNAVRIWIANQLPPEVAYTEKQPPEHPENPKNPREDSESAQ